MSGHLSSSLYSVDHAKRHVAELKRIIAVFEGDNPFAMVTDIDSDTSEKVYRVKLVKALPEQINGIVFDTVSNLRAALDHAGYAIAVADGHSGAHAHFPFGENINEIRFRAEKKRGRSRQIRNEIFDLMVAFKPYKGGNSPLLALNAMSNTHKHEFVLPKFIRTGGFQVTNLFGGEPTDMTGSGLIMACGEWDSAKQQMEFARTSLSFELTGGFNFSLKVVVGDIDIVRGQPIIDLLDLMIGEVEQVLDAVETEAKRIGIFK